MVLRKEEVVGIIVLASMILGLIAPIVAYSVAKPAEVPEAMFQFPFTGKLKYVTSKTYSVSEEFEVGLDVGGGGAEILESEKESEVKVEIFEYPAFFPFFRKPAVKEYNIEFTDNVLHVTISGYVAKVYVPPKFVKRVSSVISSGGLSVKIDAGNVETCDFKATGGGVELDLSNLGNSTISINISGGGFSGKLSYGDYVGEAKIIIYISGGGGRMDIENMGAKVKVDAAISGGGGTVGVNGVTVLSLGGASVTKTYVDEGFDEATKKLLLNIDVSGGGFQIGIRK